MNDKDRLDLAEWAIGETLKGGASGAAIEISAHRRVDVEVRDGKLDKLTEAHSNRLSVDIYLEHRFSSHSTSDLRRDALAKFIAQAADSTHYLSKDEFRALPDPDYYPEGDEPDLAIYDPAYEKIDTKTRMDLAREIEAAARAGGGGSGADRIVSSSGSYSDTYYDLVRMHSNGFVGGARGTRFEVDASVTVRDEDGSRPDDYSAAAARFRKDLPGAAVLGREATERALRKLGQKKMESGQYDCVIENRAVRRIFRVLQEPLSGRALQQKSSFLEGMLGKRVVSRELSVTDDPTLARGLGSRAFDGEGLAARKMHVFEGGVLRNYFIDSYYARKLGLAPTTAWPSNLVFNTGSKSLEELIRQMGTGILIQGFIGGNSNSTTGDFSVGVSGMLIENGEPAVPIHEMNISGNARDFFGRLAEVGNDPYAYSTMMSPSLLFQQVHFSGL
jgi:PmbA protein